MGLLDSVKSQIADAVQSQLAGIFGGSSTEGEAELSTAATDQVAEVVEQQGLGGLLQKFREGGLGETVSSWIGAGANSTDHGRTDSAGPGLGDRSEPGREDWDSH